MIAPKVTLEGLGPETILVSTQLAAHGIAVDSGDSPDIVISGELGLDPPQDALTLLTGAADTPDEAARFGDRVLGVGTVAAVRRLRTALAERIGVHADEVRAFFAADPGPLAVPLWSSAAVAGMPLSKFEPKGKRILTVQERSKLAQQSKFPTDAGDLEDAYAVVDVVRAIVDDQRVVLPVTTWRTSVAGVAISRAWLAMPTIVGANGVIRSIDEWTFNDAEAAALRATAERQEQH